ncbi:EEIG1/EHBP1 N-terminal domain-containing protein [Tanacetum coccineum]
MNRPSSLVHPFGGENRIRKTHSPAGILQVAKLHKKTKIEEGGHDCQMPTQKYVRKIIKDGSVDDHFTRGPWLCVVQYIADEGSIAIGCFGDIKTFCKNVKLEKVIAVIKSCTPNALGDLTVTLKDPSGIIFGTIHYKVLTEGVMERLLL